MLPGLFRFVTSSLCHIANAIPTTGLDQRQWDLPDQFAKLVDISSVGDIVSRQTRSASLIDSVLQLDESVNAVSIGTDDNGNAEIFRGGGVDIIKVQSTAVGVNFHHAAVISCCLKDL